MNFVENLNYYIILKLLNIKKIHINYKIYSETSIFLLYM
jgi:hypothetical protein